MPVAGFAACPSCPSLLRPQHQIELSLATAQVCSSPAASSFHVSDAYGLPAVTMGANVVAGVVFAVPSWPSALRPLHTSPPAPVIPHANCRPITRRVEPARRRDIGRLRAARGVAEAELPVLVVPQHDALPPGPSAQLVSPNDATWVHVVSAPIGFGAAYRLAPPSPV